MTQALSAKAYLYLAKVIILAQVITLALNISILLLSHYTSSGLFAHTVPRHSLFQKLPCFICTSTSIFTCSRKNGLEMSTVLQT